MRVYFFEHPSGHQAKITARSEHQAREQLETLIDQLPMHTWKKPGSTNDWLLLKIPWLRRQPEKAQN
jgi:hypothetical protein